MNVLDIRPLFRNILQAPHLLEPHEKRFTMSRRMMAAAAGRKGYETTSVHFDGSNDYLSMDANLTGVSDGKECVISVWFNVKGGDNSERGFFGAAGNTTELLLTSANKLQFDMNGASTRIITTPTFLTSGGWNHLLVSMDANAGGGNFFDMYINDTEVAYATQVVDDSDKDFTFNWTIGSRVGGGLKMFADIADFWARFDLSYDLSTTANRRKFIDAAGKPVSLGSDGSGPDGSAADIFLSGATASWHTNDGDGGGFTENGALTDGSDSPSD